MKKSKLEYVAYACLGIGFLCIIIFLGIIILYGKYGIVSEINDDSINTSANIGNFIGGIVGPLWTLAGVFLYFSALRLQSKEISENKYLLSQQQFETTFFNLLNAQDRIKNNMSGTFSSIEIGAPFYEIKENITKNINGGDFFSHAQNEIRLLFSYFNKDSYSQWGIDEVQIGMNDFFEKLDSSYPEKRDEEGIIIKDKDRSNRIDSFCSELKILYIDAIYDIDVDAFKELKSIKDEKEKCGAIYRYFHIKYQDQTAHYCRHLYNIVKYLDSYIEKLRADLPTNKREAKKAEQEIIEKGKTYVSFIQSNLSISEMFLLFYNIFIFDKAEKLYVKYNLLENLPKEKLVTLKHLALMSGIQLKSNKRLLNK